MDAASLSRAAVLRRNLANDLREEEEMKAQAAAEAASAMSMLPPILDGLARCTRCECMYDASSSTAAECCYHSGVFLGMGSTSARTTTKYLSGGAWSCCSASEEHAVGCCRAAAHLPCRLTAEALQRMPANAKTMAADGASKAPARLRLPQPPVADLSFARLQQQQQQKKKKQQQQKHDHHHNREAGQSSPRSSPRVPPRAADADAGTGGAAVALDAAASPEYGPYTVGVGDSLASVALRHGMERSALQRLNGLLSTTLYPGQVLQVAHPRRDAKTPEELRHADCRRIARRTKCAVEEAAYYLDQAGGDVARACALHAADAAWEEAAAAALASERAGKMAVASAISIRLEIARATVHDALLRSAASSVVPV